MKKQNNKFIIEYKFSAGVVRRKDSADRKIMSTCVSPLNIKENAQEPIKKLELAKVGV